jgi:hypothetical protein
MKKTLPFLFLGLLSLFLLTQCGGNQTENKQKSDSTAQTKDSSKDLSTVEKEIPLNPDEQSAEDIKEDVIKDFVGTFANPLVNINIKPLDSKNFEFELNCDMEGDCVWKKKGKATLVGAKGGVHIFSFKPKKDGEYCALSFRFDPKNVNQISFIREGECQGLQERCLSSEEEIWQKQK